MQIKPPVRATRCRTIEVDGEADKVFALLCPVLECDWLESWDPDIVYSDSGVAEPECVFVSDDGERKSIWIITDHDADARRVRMVKTTPGFTVCLLEIDVEPRGGQRSALTVRYSFTALSPEGERFVAGYTDAAYDEIMSMWQRALDHYDAEGTALPGT